MATDPASTHMYNCCHHTLLYLWCIYQLRLNWPPIKVFSKVLRAYLPLQKPYWPHENRIGLMKSVLASWKPYWPLKIRRGKYGFLKRQIRFLLYSFCFNSRRKLHKVTNPWWRNRSHYPAFLVLWWITLPNFLSTLIDHLTQLQGTMMDHVTQLLSAVIDHVTQLSECCDGSRYLTF